MDDKDFAVKLAKDYSKDEVVANLMLQLRKCSREIGTLKSEIAHLEHQVEYKKVEIRRLKEKI